MVIRIKDTWKMEPKRQIMFNVWLVSFMALYTISTYSQVLIVFMLSHTTSIFRQIAQIEHFSYAYFRVLFLACNGRRRRDPNVNVQVFCNNSLFPIYNLNSVFDLISQHNGLFSGYIMYIVRCDCHMTIHLKHPKLC